MANKNKFEKMLNTSDSDRSDSNVKISATIKRKVEKDLKRREKEKQENLKKYRLLLIKKQQLLKLKLELEDKVKKEQEIKEKEELKHQLEEIEAKLKSVEQELASEKIKSEELSNKIDEQALMCEIKQEVDEKKLSFNDIISSNKTVKTNDVKKQIEPSKNNTSSLLDEKEGVNEPIVSKETTTMPEEKPSKPYKVEEEEKLATEEKEATTHKENKSSNKKELEDVKQEKNDATISKNDTSIVENEDKQDLPQDNTENQPSLEQNLSQDNLTKEAVSNNTIIDNSNNVSNNKNDNNSSDTQVVNVDPTLPKYKATVSKSGEYVAPEESLPDNLTDEEIEQFMLHEQKVKETIKQEEEEENYEGMTEEEIREAKERRQKFKDLQEKYNTKELNADGELGDYRKNLDFQVNTGLKYFKVKPPKKPFIIAGICLAFAIILSVVITLIIANRPDAPVVLKTIKLSETTTYQYVGETVDLRGIYIDCEYSDGSKKTIKADPSMITRTSSNINASLVITSSEKSFVYFVYGNIEAKLDITVPSVKINSTSVKIYVDEYVTGDLIKFEDILILANSSVGDIKLSSENSSYLIDDIRLTKNLEGFYIPQSFTGNHDLAVLSTYNGKQYIVHIDIFITNVTATTTITEINQGEIINFNKISINANNKVDVYQNIDASACIYKIGGQELEKTIDGVILPDSIIGNQTITIIIEYNGRTLSRDISVNIIPTEATE